MTRWWLALVWLIPASVLTAQDAPVLDENSIQAWREHILPCAEDLIWQNIAWHSTYADGILAADEADKPLLLWTMNGHPFGCT